MTDVTRCAKCGNEIRWFESNVTPGNSRWLSSLNGAWCTEGERHEPEL